MGLNITEADLDGFMRRCNPKARKQIQEQLREQEERHNPQPIVVEAQPDTVVENPLPLQREVVRRESPEPVVTEVPKPKWYENTFLKLMLGAIALKMVVSFNVGELMTTILLGWIFYRYYLKRELSLMAKVKAKLRRRE
jgi:hypothetical protein